MLLRSARKAARSRLSELEPALSSPGLSATTLMEDTPTTPPADNSLLLLTPKILPQSQNLTPCTTPPPATIPAARRPSYFQVHFEKDHIATIFTPLTLHLQATNASSTWVLYKLQTNVPQRYRVLPEPFGVLKNGAAPVGVEIHVNLEEDVVAPPQLEAPPERSRSPTARPVGNTSFGGGDSLTQPPQRSRSASSKSLAGLIRHRPRESAEEISAESQAAIAPQRHAKRASLIGRRSSDIGYREDHMVTRRTLQMSFISSSLDAQQRLSDGSLRDHRDSFNGAEANEAALPDVTVTNPDGSTRGSAAPNVEPAKRHLDMIRVEARVVRRELSDAEAQQLSSSRELHRDLWATLDPGVVEMVPIRSEPVRRSEFANILSSAEPTGVQLLREEKEALQCNIRALQRDYDFQEKHQRTLGSSQAQDRASLTEELNVVNATEREVARQVMLYQRQATEHDETAARSLIVTECWNVWVPYLEGAAASMEVLLDAKVRDDQARLEQSLELQRLFGSNPYPQDELPLHWVVWTTVHPIVGWLAVAAALWTSIVAPLLFGNEYI